MDIKDSGKNSRETKTLGGYITKARHETRDGVEVGIIEGYIATWDLDRGNGWLRDKFVKGAFKKSIRELRQRGRQLRLKDHHGRTVGGFPPETLKEDSRGLFGKGEVNLDVQQGRELYSLAQQNVLVDFSVGFSVVKSNRDEQTDIRTITEAIVWEGSVVDEPMNPEANITAVKNHDDKEDGDMDPITDDEVKKFTKRDLEDALRSGKEFTKPAAKLVASLFDGAETEDEKTARETQESKDIQDAKDLQEEKDLEKVRDEIKLISDSLKTA